MAVTVGTEMNIDVSNISLSQMWQLVLALSVGTGIVMYLTKKYILLGLKTITTWNREKLNKIYEENGKLRPIISLVLLVLLFRHLLYLLVVWMGAIAWSLGWWSPPI